MPTVVVERATGARALPADFDNPRRTFTEWTVVQLCGADLRAKSPMHRELAEYLTVQKEKS